MAMGPDISEADRQEMAESSRPSDLETATTITSGGRRPKHSDNCSYNRMPANRDPRYGGNVCSKIDVTHDMVDRYESFVLGDGEKKVEIENETRVPNAAMFTFNKEDHTLGNLLRAKLVQSNHVLFAGYQVPHPLFAVFKLRVQTDGDVTPKEALVQACRDLVQELQTLDQEFSHEWELQKAKGPGMEL